MTKCNEGVPASLLSGLAVAADASLRCMPVDWEACAGYDPSSDGAIELAAAHDRFRSFSRRELLQWPMTGELLRKGPSELAKFATELYDRRLCSKDLVEFCTKQIESALPSRRKLYSAILFLSRMSAVENKLLGEPEKYLDNSRDLFAEGLESSMQQKMLPTNFMPAIPIQNLGPSGLKALGYEACPTDITKMSVKQRKTVMGLNQCGFETLLESAAGQGGAALGKLAFLARTAVKQQEQARRFWTMSKKACERFTEGLPATLAEALCLHLKINALSSPEIRRDFEAVDEMPFQDSLIKAAGDLCCHQVLPSVATELVEHALAIRVVGIKEWAQQWGRPIIMPGTLRPDSLWDGTYHSLSFDFFEKFGLRSINFGTLGLKALDCKVCPDARSREDKIWERPYRNRHRLWNNLTRLTQDRFELLLKSGDQEILAFLAATAARDEDHSRHFVCMSERALMSAFKKRGFEVAKMTEMAGSVASEAAAMGLVGRIEEPSREETLAEALCLHLKIGAMSGVDIRQYFEGVNEQWLQRVLIKTARDLCNNQTLPTVAAELVHHALRIRIVGVKEWARQGGKPLLVPGTLRDDPVWDKDFPTLASGFFEGLSYTRARPDSVVPFGHGLSCPAAQLDGGLTRISGQAPTNARRLSGVTPETGEIRAQSASNRRTNFVESFVPVGPTIQATFVIPKTIHPPSRIPKPIKIRSSTGVAKGC